MDKRLGYHGDLRNHKTPEHDEICLFIHDNCNIIINLVLQETGLLDNLKSEFEEISVKKPQFEEPVTFQKNKYNKEQAIGYIDISTGLWIEDVGSFEDYKSNNFFAGKWFYDFSDNSVFKPINFEIKPRIDSVGDVIRQIQYYKTYDEKSYATQWVVVTKTRALKKYFESQGIVLFEYDELKNRVAKVKEEAKKIKEEKELREEAEKLAETLRTKKRQEKIQKIKSKTKGFITGLFKSSKSKD